MELRGLAALLPALLPGASAYGAACHRCAKSGHWLQCPKLTFQETNLRIVRLAYGQTPVGTARDVHVGGGADRWRRRGQDASSIIRALAIARSCRGVLSSAWDPEPECTTKPSVAPMAFIAR